ncbi:MAG TPA: hypothetical protein VMP67_04750 [Candidatus Limnocylindria bacterium]|nr:hypothetical protein [Candidatus Limnocylindria bacterium]
MEPEREQFDSLGDLFTALAAKLGEVNADVHGEITEYRRGEVRFALADSDGAELRLHPEIAEAARRTPSTAACERGPEWVRFAPPEVDRHALDRAEAWFLSAWRAAGQAR